MTIAQGAEWIAEHKEELIASLIYGGYQPQPVRGVWRELRTGDRRAPAASEAMSNQWFQTQGMVNLTDTSRYNIKGNRRIR